MDDDVETDAGTFVVRRPVVRREEPGPAGTTVEVDLVEEAVWTVAE